VLKCLYNVVHFNFAFAEEGVDLLEDFDLMISICWKTLMISSRMSLLDLCG
jgi:hypothetical protein